jgi:hypothetical protein
MWTRIPFTHALAITLDITFNYLKKERRGVKPAEGDVLYTELSRQASG